jgi:hypothetical protein
VDWPHSLSSESSLLPLRVVEGGETVFPQLDVRIAARQGRLLAFPPYWMFQHAGLPPLSGDKYILSTYLLF